MYKMTPSWVVWFLVCSGVPAVGAEPPEIAAQIQVTGHVVDAETGKPVPHFVTQGGRFDPKDPSKVSWGYSVRRSGAASGYFSANIRWPQGWTARILADGYLPQPVLSEPPPAGTKKLTRVLKLTPGRPIRGRIVDHEGQPVPDAAVFAVGSLSIALHAGKAVQSHGIDDTKEDTTRRPVKTDKDGRFTMRLGEAERLAISTPHLNAWSAPLPPDEKEVLIELPEPARLVLWYDIDGAADEEQFYWQFLGHEIKAFKGITANQYAKVKRRDTLVLSGMTPGPYQLVRYRMLRTDNMGISAMMDRRWLDLKPGERKVVRFLRTSGAQVSGHIKGLKEARLSEVLISVRPEPQPEPPEGRNIGNWLVLDARVSDRDGKFVTERLPPGNYRADITGYRPIPPERLQFSGIIGPSVSHQLKFTVPEKGEPKPLEFQLQPFKPLVAVEPKP